MINPISRRYRLASFVVLMLHLCFLGYYIRSSSSNPLRLLSDPQSMNAPSNHMQIKLIRTRIKKEKTPDPPIPPLKKPVPLPPSHSTLDSPTAASIKNHESFDTVRVDSDAKIDQDAQPSLGTITNDYLSNVMAKIERHKRYPRPAIRRQREGEVVIGFTINKNGTVPTVNILQSSQYNIFDHAAIAAVQDASPFEAIPDQLNKPEFVIHLTISFKLD